MIVQNSVGGSTFRSFKNMPTSPSKVYRDWAKNRLSDKNIIKRIKTIRTQNEYDNWIIDFCEKFGTEWRNQMGNDNLILHFPRKYC